MNTPALHMPSNNVVDVIQDGEELAYVKFPNGKVLWVKVSEIDFDSVVPEGLDDDLDDDPRDYDFDDPRDYDFDCSDRELSHYDYEYDR